MDIQTTSGTRSPNAIAAEGRNPSACAELPAFHARPRSLDGFRVFGRGLARAAASWTAAALRRFACSGFDPYRYGWEGCELSTRCDRKAPGRWRTPGRCRVNKAVSSKARAFGALTLRESRQTPGPDARPQGEVGAAHENNDIKRKASVNLRALCVSALNSVTDFPFSISHLPASNSQFPTLLLQRKAA